jgi:MFS transporter, DHA1 family, multidrug resistance protein
VYITTIRPRRRLELALLLGALSAFPPLTIDLYLPGMPTIARDLASSPGLVQLTVTVFVVGLAAGQLVVGPLSDVHGRRPLLVGGLVAYVVGSVVCLVAPTAGWLLAARVVQALGAAAATVLSRAVVRDLFEGSAMTRFLSNLLLVNGIATVAGPLVGAQLIVLGGWRSVFAVLAVLGVALLLAVVVRLPESLPAGRRRAPGARAVVRSMAGVCRDDRYVRYSLAAALMFASMFAYISASSFVLQGAYGLSAGLYSVVFAGNAMGIVLAGQLNSLLLGRRAFGRALDERLLLVASLVVGAVAGLGVLLSVAAHLPLGWLLVSLFVLVSTLGPVLTDATSLALAGHGASAGTAASLQGVLQYAVAGAAASAMSGFGGSEVTSLALAMGLTIAVTSVSALVVAVQRRRATVLVLPEPATP